MRKSEETSYYERDEDDDPLMLHMQRTPQPGKFKFPDLEKYDVSRDFKEQIQKYWAIMEI